MSLTITCNAILFKCGAEQFSPRGLTLNIYCIVSAEKDFEQIYYSKRNGASMSVS